MFCKKLGIIVGLTYKSIDHKKVTSAQQHKSNKTLCLVVDNSIKKNEPSSWWKLRDIPDTDVKA